jgi:hypothetical protein
VLVGYRPGPVGAQAPTVDLGKRGQRLFDVLADLGRHAAMLRL